MTTTSAKPANVEYERPELSKLVPRWNLVNDCLMGQDEVKLKGTTYLPKPNPTDTSNENEIRYEQYLLRAVFYGVTGRTLQGMIGTVFQKKPELEIPEQLKVMNEDADGGGVGLEQQAKKALSNTVAFGRCGVLVDYPAMPNGASKRQIDTGEVHPNILLFQPWQIINWRTTLIQGVKKLTLIVIKETYVSEDDGFEAKQDVQYRVLRLVAGEYVVEIHRKTSDTFGVVSVAIPKDGNGKPWDVIPFSFIGSENNDEACDQPPLYDLATLNIAHYRNSADYEEACFLLGQPTPWASGLSEEWVNNVLKGTIPIGSRAVIPLPVDGQAGLLQVTPNTMPKEAMEMKEKQMVALGAKLVEQREVRQTATEASQNEASETSVLATSANNVSAAYSKALQWCARFIGKPSEKIQYKLSTEFDKRFASAQDLQALVAIWQANAISDVEMRSQLTKAGVASQDLETWREALETAGPGLGVPVKERELENQDADREAQAQALKAKTDAAAKKASASSKK